MTTKNEIQIYESGNIADIKKTAWLSLSKNSQESYQFDYNLFFEYIQKNPDEITPADILKYTQYMETEKKYRINTINRKISSLSKMFEIMVLAGEIKNNPVSILKKLKKINQKSNREVRNVITIEDVRQAIKIDKYSTIFEKKNSVLIEILAKTGLRISELLNIEHADIKDHDGKNKVIRIIGKGRKERFVFIENVLFNKIMKLWPEKYDFVFYSQKKQKYDRKSVFRIIEEIFQRKCKKKVSPHILRHFFATYKLHVEKKDIKAVSLYLGHSSTNITMDFYLDTALNVKQAGIKI